MLSDATPITTLPTSDLARARGFYEGVLGFAPADQEMPGGVIYTSGSGSFGVYESPFAGTNQATAMSWWVTAAELDSQVSALRQAGVAFETWEAEEVTWDDGVASMAGMGRGVWFKDPDGTILNITQPPE